MSKDPHTCHGVIPLRPKWRLVTVIYHKYYWHVMCQELERIEISEMSSMVKLRATESPPVLIIHK